MRFELVEQLHGPLDKVEAVFFDPEFIAESATLPKLGSPVLLDQQDQGEKLRQRVRYRFVGQLSPVVTAIIDPSRLTWVEDTTLDRKTHHISWQILPDNYASLLSASGDIALVPTGDNTVERRVEGEVRVRVPLVGKKAEAAIVSGLREHAALEADLVNRWVASHF